MTDADASALCDDGAEAIRWDRGRLWLLDQRRLPEREAYLELTDVGEVASAIRDLVVRGAPAIGIAAAYGAVMAARARGEDRSGLAADLDLLQRARPTAVNLGWAIERMRRLVGSGAEALEAEARRIHRLDIEANRRMGALGAGLIAGGSRVLTHCNTGALATGGFGTALGVIRQAYREGRIDRIYAGETRPWMQGARLTAWELCREGIPVTLVLEGAVASLCRDPGVDWLIVGADRIVANGDVANKIGTLSAAVHARRHGGRVMVVAPCSTVDLATRSGDGVPIETRDAAEVLEVGGRRIAAPGAEAWNPVFDITPHDLVDAIVTEGGVARPPFAESLPEVVAAGGAFEPVCPPERP